MGGKAGQLVAAVALMFLAGCGAPAPAVPPDDDPLSAVDDPGRRVDLLQQLDTLPRYEAASRVLAANPVPLDHDVAVPADAIAGRYRLDTDHLVVSTLAQAGRLPADVPDLDAVTDETGRLSPLRSFSDGSPDPDVTAVDVPPDAALAAITRTGPAGAGPDWGAAVGDHHRMIATELRLLDPDEVRPEPRTPLESGEVDRLRGRDRIPWGFM